MNGAPVRDELLVLRCISLGDSSKIVSGLAERCGKVRLVAKGVKSPRSKMAGLLEPGNEIEVLFYARENRDLWILSEASLRRAALTGRSSLDKLSHLFAALELGDRLLHDFDAATEYVPHFRGFMDAWHQGEDAEMASLFFALEMRMLTESGWGIDPHDCVQCDRPLLREELDVRAYWSAADGRLTCQKCAGIGGRWVEAEVVQALASVALPSSGSRNFGGRRLDERSRRGVGRLLHEHMGYHLPRYRLPKSLYWLQQAASDEAAEAR